MSSCCRTPRHKRLVNTLYPDDPQNGDPVGGDLEKLLYFSRSEPDRLDDVGGYLVFKLRRSLARERRGHVSVSLKIMEKLLTELSIERRQLLAESFLEMLHELLHSNQLFYHNMAANSFVMFSELEEDRPPYHRQYEFCIERFAAMCLVKKQNEQYLESRRSGLRALKGIFHKVGSEGGDMWDSDHLNKILPAFLINMQDYAHDIDLDPNAVSDRASLGGREHLGELGEAGLKELVAIASLVHANAVLDAVLQHFDYCNVWLEDGKFAEETFIIITSTMEPQVRYLVIQSLLSHVDAKSNTEKQLKGVILNVLSRCVGVAADESIGPSVLDVFQTLIKQLKKSVEDSKQSDEFHESIVKMVGEFAAVLPDFHNPDIMNLILSYLPYESDKSLVLVKSKQDKHAQLMSLLVKCLLAVANSSKPAMLDTTLTEMLMTSLGQLLEVTEPDIQLDVLLLWQRMVDHHGNIPKIPLNTTWDSLGHFNLVLGKTTGQFQYLCRKIMIPMLVKLVEGVVLRKPNITECYYLLCSLGLEFGVNGLPEICLLATEIQDLALSQPSISVVRRLLLHSYTAGILHLAAIISESDTLGVHVNEILENRQQLMPRLLPDTTIDKWEESVDQAESMTDEMKDNLQQCRFQLKEKGLIQSNTELLRNSSAFARYHWEAGHSFRSRSIDQPDDDKETTDITFENLKRESILGIDGNVVSIEDGDGNSSKPLLSYEEMLHRVTNVSSFGDDVSDILKSSSPRSTIGNQRTLPTENDMPSFT